MIRVRDIITEVEEVTGVCTQSVNFQAITRAVQLLANKKLIDPLMGYLDFSVDESYMIAMPRDVKTVLRVNINGNPSFSRSRLFEFSQNTEGTVEGEEIGWSWADRLYSPIQNEKNLPGTLSYKLDSSADNGATCIVRGLDEDGREITETLVGAATSPAPCDQVFHKIVSISRSETTAGATLLCNGDNPLAQFYGDETAPSYRVIKLSKKVVNIRIIFRRDVFRVTSLDDVLPMQSAMAVIHAARAVRFYAQDEDEKAEKAEERAVKWLTEEQASREEHNAISGETEIITPLDTTIGVRDSIIVRDVYDVASEIFGPIGRRKLFDKISMAIEVLANKAHWDAGLGYVDIWTNDRSQVAAIRNKKGVGTFILPRFVETPVAIQRVHDAIMPRNRWYEFGMNGYGEQDFSPYGSWDDAGESVLCKLIPIDQDTKKPIPTKFVAVPNSSADDDTEIRIYGYELDDDGVEREVWRGNSRGWLCPCVADSNDPGDDAPEFVRVERITKADSLDYIKLYAVTYTAEVPAVPETPESDVFTYEIASQDFPFTAGDLVIESPEWLDSESHNWTFEIDGLGAGGYSFSVRDENDNLLITAWNVYFDTPTVCGNPGEVQFTVTIPPTGAGPIGDGQITGTLTRAYTPYDAGSPAVPEYWTLGDVHGYWYPDENEPRYRVIKLPTDKAERIRVCYRKRTLKVTSLLEPIPLRSLLALQCQLQALKAIKDDPQAAMNFETMAIEYLNDARIQEGPSRDGTIQVDTGSSPMLSTNVQ